MSVGMLALKLAVTGMGTVFVILCALGLMMHCFKLVFSKSNQAGAESEPVLCENLPTGEENGEELVAVFAAASYYARLRYKRPVLVKAVTPVWDGGQESTWLTAGRSELVNSNLYLRSVN